MEALDGVHGFLARVLDATKRPIGTAFQIDSGLIVTAAHVVLDAMDGREAAEVYLQPFLPVAAEPVKASVSVIDHERDIALLKTETPLVKNAPFLAYSDIQVPGTEFVLVGYGAVPGGYGNILYNTLSAKGTWEGRAEEVGGRIMIRGHASGTARGMSGCPVLRISDGAVIGMLSSRYNSADSWSSHRINIVRVEDLESLLEDGHGVPIDKESPQGPSSSSQWIGWSELHRNRLVENKFFVLEGSWKQVWLQAIDGLADCGVIVVVARPGVGSTTFAERVLAYGTSGDTRLVRLEPGDWKEPSIRAIPRRPRQAAVLDLQDPDCDRPSSEFVGDLASLASHNIGMRSRLLITVRNELWPGSGGIPLPGVKVLYLDSPPPARETVGRYLGLRAPELSESISDPRIMRYFEGRNAVQIVAIVERILAAKDRASSSGETAIFGPEDLLSLLDDHVDDLDLLFAGPDRRGKQQSIDPLPIEDRFLMIALAVRREVGLSQLERDAEALAKVIFGKKDGGYQVKPGEALASAGIRGRLASMQAKLSAGEIAAFERPNLADSVFMYVWGNYAQVREPLTRWLLDLPKDGSSQFVEVSRLLSHVLIERQDVEFIKTKLLPIVKEKNQYEVLAEILMEVVDQPHMQRRCDRLLYEWAVRDDLQPVVTSVATKMLGSRREMALRRLRRVADSDKLTREVRDTILRSFQGLLNEPSTRAWFLEKATSWFREAPESAAAAIAFSALLDLELERVPWLLLPEATGPDVDRMLSGVITDPAAADSLARLATRACEVDEDYQRLLDRVCRAAAENGAISGVVSFAVRLAEVGSVAGRDPVADLDRRLKLQVADVPLESLERIQ